MNPAFSQNLFLCFRSMVKMSHLLSLIWEQSLTGTNYGQGASQKYGPYLVRLLKLLLFRENVLGVVSLQRDTSMFKSLVQTT